MNGETELPAAATPAFPCETTELQSQAFKRFDARSPAAVAQEFVHVENVQVKHAGLTKREYMATQIMAAISLDAAVSIDQAPEGERTRRLGHEKARIAALAVEFADALLAALHPTPNPQPPTSGERSQP